MGNCWCTLLFETHRTHNFVIELKLCLQDTFSVKNQIVYFGCNRAITLEKTHGGMDNLIIKCCQTFDCL